VADSVDADACKAAIGRFRDSANSRDSGRISTAAAELHAPDARRAEGAPDGG
jgi:hypothetical protein